MQNYERVTLNKYGYYELKDKLSDEDRQNLFKNRYYQENMGSYQKSYSKQELCFIRCKLEQKAYIYSRAFSDGELNGEGKTFLDIGCGEGFALSFFSDKGMSVKGIDISEWGIKEQNPDMLPNFIQGDCLDVLPSLADSGEKFDIINMDESLDMMTQPEFVLKECKRLLKSKGILGIKVANNYSMLQRKLLAEGRLKKEYWLDYPGHPSYFNSHGLISLLEDYGYKCIDIYGESFIDLNLLNPDTNYYENPEAGKNCYNARVELEMMMHEISIEKTMQVYKLLGEMGLGREIIGIFKVDN